LRPFKVFTQTSEHSTRPRLRRGTPLFQLAEPLFRRFEPLNELLVGQLIAFANLRQSLRLDSFQSLFGLLQPSLKHLPFFQWHLTALRARPVFLGLLSEEWASGLRQNQYYGNGRCVYQLVHDREI
jgi:hypothetical protein